MNISSKSCFLLLIISFLCFNVTGQAKKEKVVAVLQKNEWFTDKLFFSNVAEKKYELRAIKHKKQYKKAIGAAILSFYTTKESNHFTSYENLPRCGLDVEENGDGNIRGEYKILTGSEIEVERIVVLEGVFKNDVFKPTKTKKMTSVFKVTQINEKIYLQKVR